MSTFYGLELAKKALSAQQAALYTTGHNISNAHTEGYSRQRVNFETDSPFPPASRNRPEIPGQMGTGVKIGTIERIRDKFLDMQFRTENSRVGYWNTQQANLSRIEDLLNEPSDSGLSKTMKQFWQSLEDLAVNPENTGARSVVKERGVTVADTFNYLSETLHSVHSDVKSEIEITEDRVNTLLKDINSINQQIQRIEPHGYLPNDLYDDRDRLIDELSSIVNIKVDTTGSGGGSLPSAEGIVSIELVGNKGNSLGGGESPENKILLIDGKADDLDGVNEITINFSDGDSKVQDIAVGNYEEKVSFADIKETGSLMGLIDTYGYEGQPKTKMSIPGLLNDLDKMAFAFVKEFNEQHKKGYDFEGKQGENFFDEIVDQKGAAGSIQVSESIINEPNKIAASSQDSNEGGNGKNALELAKVFDKSIKEDADNPEEQTGLNGKSINSFFQSLIGEIGVAGEEAIRRTDNTNTLLSQVEDRRMSTSAVSLDEEMTNMIKFQHAYNAAARSMTTVDEMLDRIINNMGLVGR